MKNQSRGTNNTMNPNFVRYHQFWFDDMNMTNGQAIPINQFPSSTEYDD
jgi:hypothetical protein